MDDPVGPYNSVHIKKEKPFFDVNVFRYFAKKFTILL